MVDATKILDGLDQRELRDRLRRVEEERASLIALIRAAAVRERTRREQREGSHATR